MFDNWKVYKGAKGSKQIPMIASGVDGKWAADLVDKCHEAGYASYAVDPNGNTYPPDLHDDGDYDPAFS